MKTTLLFLLGVSTYVFAQHSADTAKTKFLSFIPLSAKTAKVNGMAIGIGHPWDQRGGADTINGLDIELNPLTPLIVLLADPERVTNDKVTLVHNGLHIAVGGFLGGAVHNGVGVSVYNVGIAANGATLNVLYNATKSLNGLHISGIANTSEDGAGVLISPLNYADKYKGLQLGVYNHSESYSGMQVGVINRSKGMRGLQIGLWNINEKRSLPFINW